MAEIGISSELISINAQSHNNYIRVESVSPIDRDS